MKRVRPTSNPSQKYGNAHIKNSHLTCTIATRPNKLFGHSKHISFPSLLALIHLSQETDGIYSYLKQRSRSTSYDNHCYDQTSLPGSTLTAHLTSMLHPCSRQDVRSLPMQKGLHNNLGTTAATKVSTSDRHRTTSDASRSSKRQQQQSSSRTQSSSNTRPCQCLH
jgi:hypothetical protein